LLKWIIHAVCHCCSDLASAIVLLVSHLYVLVLSNGQFEMTAHIAAAVLNRVYARHKHHEPAAANIFGGSQAKLIVAYTKNRSIGAHLIRARLYMMHDTLHSSLLAFTLYVMHAYIYHEWCNHACLTPSLIRLHYWQLKLAVLPACQPLLFLTCHVIFDLSSVYHSRRMHVEFCTPA
jgi:hypothetical protein